MRMNTDHLLTLGMALTTDKRAMERRVRGVFARRSSTKRPLRSQLACGLDLRQQRDGRNLRDGVVN